MKKKLKLSKKDLITELSERSGNDKRTILKIIECYEDIVFQCLKNKIEVSFGGLGTFTFKEVLPRDYIEWKGFTDNREYTIFFQKNTDGFIKGSFRMNPTFKRTLREQTCIPHGSVASDESVYADSENDINKPRVDFEKYLEELRAKKAENEGAKVKIDNINPEEDEYDNITLEEENIED